MVGMVGGGGREGGEVGNVACRGRIPLSSSSIISPTSLCHHHHHGHHLTHCRGGREGSREGTGVVRWGGSGGEGEGEVGQGEGGKAHWSHTASLHTQPHTHCTGILTVTTDHHHHHHLEWD